MSAILVAAVLLPLASVTPSPGMVKDVAELAGRIESRAFLSPPIGYQIKASNARDVLAEAPVGPDGTYRLHIPPGDYTLSVSAFGVEVHRQRITVKPECSWVDLHIPDVLVRGDPSPERRVLGLVRSNSWCSLPSCQRGELPMERRT
jgi:hypothetical protein